MISPNNPMAPGVYVVENNAFPSGVDPAPTAVPAFIGYTQRAILDGTAVTAPVLVKSLAEYEQIFGGRAIRIAIVRAGDPSPADSFEVGGQVYVAAPPATGQRRCLRRCLELFFLNGGDQCYVASIGSHEDVVRKDAFLSGLEQLTKIGFPTPTMISMPDALSLPRAEYYAVIQQALEQCGTRKDRIALIDVHDGDQPLSSGVIDDCRTMIGTQNLSYGACYYPFLETTIVAASDLGYANIDQTSEGAVPLATLLPSEPEVAVDGPVPQLLADLATTRALATPPPLDPGAALPSTLGPNSTGARYDSWRRALDAAPGSADDIEANRWKARVVVAMAMVLRGVSLNSQDTKSALTSLMDSRGTLAKTLAGLARLDAQYPNGALGVITAERLDALFPDAVIPTKPQPKVSSTLVASELSTAFATFERAILSIAETAQQLLANRERALQANNADYQRLLTAVHRLANILPPGPAVAGVICTVDNTDGVWAAPANVDIASVKALTVTIDDAAQSGLNVDAASGKSINAIRSFPGRGSAIIWGARTLDGNSEDGRYINVRRTLIMLEQLVADAAQQLVFSANDANTWQTCESVLRTALTNVWEQGGLVGATAADAFSVEVGVGRTMTTQDVTAGIMRIIVKVALTHPADFSVISYTQKMAQP